MEGQNGTFRGRVAALVVGCLAAGGCSSFMGTTAASFLRQVKESPDPNVRFLAYSKLASPNSYDSEDQKREVVRVLSAKLDDPKAEPLVSRAAICRTLGELKRPEARPALLKVIDDPEPSLRFEAAHALGRVGNPEDVTVLVRVMAADTSPDCKVAAIEAIGALKPADPRIALSLAEGMDNQSPSEGPAIRLASLRALRSITGKDFGVEPGPWRKYVQDLAAKADAKTDATAKR
jgi:HEAT repeat protein